MKVLLGSVTKVALVKKQKTIQQSTAVRKIPSPKGCKNVVKSQ
jgi:hypothetical protein